MFKALSKSCENSKIIKTNSFLKQGILLQNLELSRLINYNATIK